MGAIIVRGVLSLLRTLDLGAYFAYYALYSRGVNLLLRTLLLGLVIKVSIKAETPIRQVKKYKVFGIMPKKSILTHHHKRLVSVMKNLEAVLESID